jgi:hypothetical protein
LVGRTFNPRSASCFTFDLDAEYVFLGTNPDVARMSIVLSFYPSMVLHFFSSR